MSSSTVHSPSETPQERREPERTPSRPPGRLTRGTTAEGRRHAAVQVRGHGDVRMYAGPEPGAVFVHVGPLMLRAGRDVIEAREDHGVVTVQLGGASIADATSEATDGAWPLALAWVLDGDRQHTD